MSPRNCAKLKKKPDLVSFINQNLLTNVFITYSPVPNKHTYTFIVFCKFGSPYMPN